MAINAGRENNYDSSNEWTTHTHIYTQEIQYMQVNKFGVVKNGWRKESTQ